MADKEINDLTDGGAAVAGDLVHVVRSGNSRKAALGDAAGKSVGTGAGTVAAGDDSRITGAIAASLLTTRGDILYRNATVPARLAKGSAGQVFEQGADDPAWADRTKIGSVQATTTGSSKEWTGIPPWAKVILVNFAGVSSNGTAVPLLQLGDSGGYEITGYLGGGGYITASCDSVLFTAGFGLAHAMGAASLLNGTMMLSLVDPSTNTWSAFGLLARSDAVVIQIVAGTKSLSAALDRLRIITTDTLDAGKSSITYF